MSVDWPTVELNNVQRMRVLAGVVPNATVGETIVDAPFDRVWSWFSDIERSVPAFDGQVRRVRIRRRVGDEIEMTAWSGPGAMLPLRFDVLLEPSGWCLMIGQARLYVVGMSAVPVGEHRTHVALLEAVPRRFGGLVAPSMQRHVRGDVRRIARVLGVDSRPV
jgi:hypothetical protein